MEDRDLIAELLKQTRRQRELTQSQVAKIIGLSQSRYSEIEQAKGTLSAEQLLTFMRAYNISFEYFNPQKPQKSLQQLKLALSHWGKQPLEDLSTGLIHSNLYDIYGTVTEVLVGMPRKELICALGPVLITQCHVINFDSMGMKLYDLGVDGRLWWLVEGLLWAIRDRLKWFISREIKEMYQAAEEILSMKSRASNAFFSLRKAYPVDILDHDIKTMRVMEKVRSERDTLAVRWRIITRIKIEDFSKTLEAWEKS